MNLGRLEREQQTVNLMIGIYCRAKHGGQTRCDQCSGLTQYTDKRTQACRYSNRKPPCKECPTHCYSPKMRERIKVVMRYAGQRMLWTHPIVTVRHVFDKISYIIRRTKLEKS